MWPGNKQECSYYIEVEGLEVEERAGKRTFSLYITVIGSLLSVGNMKKKKESYRTVITCTVYRISARHVVQSAIRVSRFCVWRFSIL